MAELLDLLCPQMKSIKSQLRSQTMVNDLAMTS